MRRTFGILATTVALVGAAAFTIGCRAPEPTPIPTPTPTSTPEPTPGPMAVPTAAPIATATVALTPTSAPGSEEATSCLEEVLSPEELVNLGSGRVPLISTLIAVQQCQGQLGEVGATFPLNVDQLECLKLYAGDDTFQALADTTSPPEDILSALEICSIELETLMGP